MKLVLYDVTHTSHCDVNSGIQRVVRRLAKHWPVRSQAEEVVLQPVVYDSYLRAWRFLDGREKRLLDFDEQMKPGQKRGAAWTLWQRVRGRWSRRLGKVGQTWQTVAGARDLSVPNSRGDSKTDKNVCPTLVSAFICPELFAGDKRRENFDQIKTQWAFAGFGKTIAIFYDIIAIDMPEKMPAIVVSRYRDYLERLREFDVVAAISEDSKERLLRYWREQGQIKIPEVVAIPLGVDPVVGAECVPAGRAVVRLLASLGTPKPQRTARRAVPTNGSAGVDFSESPLVLSVGTLEGRKNHIALLEACESLWKKGIQFRLRLIGMLNKETGATAADKVASLQAAGHPVEWWPDAEDELLFASYRECDFTVYPSLYEGFGLPVLESLAHGRPCVCSGLNAMAEIVQGGGGCVATGEPTAENIARAMEPLLRDRARVVALSKEALARKIRSWDDYAGDMRALACG